MLFSQVSMTVECGIGHPSTMIE